MNRLLLIFAFISIAHADLIKVEIREKSSGKVLAGDTGEGMTFSKVQQAMYNKKGALYDPIRHEIVTVNISQNKAAKKASQANFGKSHAKYDAILLDMIKDYLKRKDINPED